MKWSNYFSKFCQLPTSFSGSVPPRGTQIAQITVYKETVHAVLLEHNVHILCIHPKSNQIGGDLLLSTIKLAEEMCKSGRQIFATKVR